MNTKHIHHFMCSAAAALLLASSAAGALQDVQRLDKIISDLTRLRCREASCIEAQSKLLTLLQALRRDMPNDASVRLTGDGRTALHFAAILGSRQSVEWLLANYAEQWYTDPYGTPFMCTTDDNGPAIRALLVQKAAFGIDPRPTASALPAADAAELDKLLQSLYKLRCRERSYQFNHENLLVCLEKIRAGHAVNAYQPADGPNNQRMNRTALQYACGLGSLNAVKWLLAHGADPTMAADEGKLTTRDCVADDQRAQILAALDAAARNWQGNMVEFDLANGQHATLPRHFLDSLGPVVDELKGILSPEDYAQIIIGLAAWNKSRSSGGQDYEVGGLTTIDDLKKRLQAVRDDPGNEHVFVRSHMISPFGEGVSFVRDLTNSTSRLEGVDDTYIFSNADKGFDFWNPHTTRLVAGYRCNILSSLHRIKGTSMYAIVRHQTEGGAPMWNGISEHQEVLDPVSLKCCTMTMGNSRLYWHDDAGALNMLHDMSMVKAIREDQWESMVDERSGYLIDIYDYQKKTQGQGVEYFFRYSSKNSHDALDMPGQVTATGSDSMGGRFYFKTSAGEYQGMLPHTLSAGGGEKHKHYDEQMSEAKESLQRELGGLPSIVENIQGDHYSEKTGLNILSAAGEATAFILDTGFSHGETGPDPCRLYMLAGIRDKSGQIFLFDDNFDRTVGYTQKGQLNSGKLYSYSSVVRGNMVDVDSPDGKAVLRSEAPIILSFDLTDCGNGKYMLFTVRCDSFDGRARAMLTEIDLNARTFEDKATFPCAWEGAAWLQEQHLLLLPEESNKYSIHRLDESYQKEFIAHLYWDAGRGYAIVLPDGRYMGTPGCEHFLQYQDKAGHLVGMKALAPWLNRPGDVLEALGGDADSIAALRAATERWLKRSGVGGGAMPALESFARAEIRQYPPLVSPGETCSFSVRVKAGDADVKELRVQADSTDLPSVTASLPQAGGTGEVPLTVPLIKGQNWITVTPVDARGIAGESARFRVIYEGAQAPAKRYVLALGVSDYDNGDMKLQYAAKDATDISGAFARQTDIQTEVKLVTDKEVTRANTLAVLKDFLASARPQDQVVVYLAGHGFLDEQLNYRYAVCDYDGDRLAETSVSMDEITGAVAASPARKRLLILDTCHAGALGEAGEEKMAMAMNDLPHGVRAVKTRGMKVKAVPTLSGTQQKRYIEELFSMGGDNRGINTIAASAGSEFAMESAEWNNGVLTATILQMFKSPETYDSDMDGTLSVKEMCAAVVGEVGKMTAGHQQPNIVNTEEAYSFVMHGASAEMRQPGLPLSKLLDGEGHITGEYVADEVSLEGRTVSRGTFLTALRENHHPFDNNRSFSFSLPVNANCKSWVSNGVYYTRAVDGYEDSCIVVGARAVNGRLQIVSVQTEAEYNATKGNIRHPAHQPSSSVPKENRSDLQPLLDRMAALRCKHASSAEQQRHLLQLLPMIRDGASVDVVAPDDPYRRTALHYSCAIGSLGITTWLVNHGANVNAADANGKTPLSMVGADNRAAITKLLKQHGAGCGETSFQPVAQPEARQVYTGTTEERAAAGDMKAQVELGFNYRDGKNGYAKNAQQAFRWFKMAAEQGSREGQNCLGNCYHRGLGCKKDLAQAFYWYKQSADAGAPLAKSNLGTCYENGWGTPKNKDKAVELYREAARLGNPSAQKHLKRLKLSW